MQAKNKKNAYAYTAATLRIFWQHSKRYPGALWTLALSVIAITALQTYTPVLYRDLVDVLNAAEPLRQAGPAIRIVFIILLVNGVKMVIWRSVLFVASYFELSVIRDLSNTCYQYMQKHAYGFFNSRFVGSLVTKVRRYERGFEQVADQLFFDLGRSLLDTAMVVALLLWTYPQFGYGLLAWAAVFLLFTYFYTQYKLPYDLLSAAADTQVTAQLADSLTNNLNIKLFTNYAKENQRFGAVTQGRFLTRKKSWSMGLKGEIVQGLLVVVLEFFVIYFAVRFWQADRMTVGGIVLLQAYVFRISDKLWSVGRYMRSLYEAVADANEMTEILLEPHTVRDMPAAANLVADGGRVEFQEVHFGYYDKLPVLKNFNFEVAPGERVALIGPSGGGKSTILRLLLRLHDIGKGEILIDGQDISRATQDSLRQAIAFVPQEPILFHRSLMENIRYAKPKASDKEVFRAARLAHAHEFINSFPQKYETLVGERGVKLSGGERQRVAIARAILKDAPILMLDEATSSLDSESEKYIQDALKNLMRGRTTIVVAHRLSTIMQMDRIVVIDHGRIIEEGKHKELLKVRQGLYQRLWGIQAGGFAAG